MSDYNRNTGVLKLTLDEAHTFHTTSDRNPGEYPPMQFYADKLQNLGLEIISVTEEYLEVKAPQNEVWELLSGQHSYL